MKKKLFALFSLLFTLTLCVDMPSVNATENTEELEYQSNIPPCDSDQN